MLEIAKNLLQPLFKKSRCALKGYRTFCFCIPSNLSSTKKHLFTSHTVRKSRNMNTANYVSNFLICGTYDIVEHYWKRIKILHRWPFESWPTLMQLMLVYHSRKPVFSNGHPCRISIFPIMFCYIFSNTYHKVEDIVCPFIFLEFHTVWSHNWLKSFWNRICIFLLTYILANIWFYKIFFIQERVSKDELTLKNLWPHCKS